MTDEMHQELMDLLGKYCGSQYEYNWDNYEDGKIYLRLTFKLKQEAKS